MEGDSRCGTTHISCTLKSTIFPCKIIILILLSVHKIQTQPSQPEVMFDVAAYIDMNNTLI